MPRPAQDGLAGVNLTAALGIDEEQLLLDPERVRTPFAESRFVEDPVAVFTIALPGVRRKPREGR
jgi:hypothetical protein